MNKDNAKDLKADQSKDLGCAQQGETGEKELLDAGTVDAGIVEDLNRRPIKVEKVTHRAKMASYLAFILVAILFLTLLLHYFATLILSCYGQAETVQVLGEVFDKWLPVITGFVGGAVTYYFTKEKS